MRRFLIVVLTALLAAPGCASYTPSSAPVPVTSSMPACMIDGPMSVGADPYTQKERQKSFFDGDLNGAGVIPVQVSVVNNGENTVLVRGSDVLLILADGTQMTPASASAASVKMESNAGVVAAAIGFGLVGALVASSAEDKARAARVEDFKRKEFKEAKIAPGQSANGFLYFIPIEGTKAFSEATLQFQFVDTENACGQVVRLPLKNLGYTGKPAPQQEEGKNQ